MGELEFFIAGRMEEDEEFNGLKLTPAAPAVGQASDGTQVVSPQIPILRRSEDTVRLCDATPQVKPGIARIIPGLFVQPLQL